MSEQANCCCAGRKNGCEKVNLIPQSENACTATSSCCQRRCIIQQLANKTFKVCEPVFMDNDFNFTASSSFTEAEVIAEVVEESGRLSRYSKRGSSKCGSSKSGSSEYRSSKYGGASSGTTKYTSPSCCDTVSITEIEFLDGFLDANATLCPKFNLRCNTCYDYMLFGCPRTTCQAISAAGIGAWITDRDYLSSGDACLELAKQCVFGCSGTGEDAKCDVSDDPYNGKTDKNLNTYYFTYSLTWQQCVGAFEVHINVCGLPIQGSGWWTGDPTCNIQLSQTTPLFDALRKFNNNIYDAVEEAEAEAKTDALQDALQLITGSIQSNGDTLKKVVDSDGSFTGFVDCLDPEVTDFQKCIEDEIKRNLPASVTANFGYSLGSASVTLVPYNSCRTSHYARREICSAQHCLDSFNRQLRTSKRRKGKRKPTSGSY